ncbi:MAG: HAMP domain-containing protein [Planctomycetes bacterium]|nr:HAMP domain-containing protein [Planctomycetota bacterium]
MKLRSKVLVSAIGGIVVLNAVLYVATDAVVMSGFLAEERVDADRAVNSTREIVRTMLEESLARTTDWAEWDATAKLVDGDNPTYAEENIEPGALAALGWDVVYVARPPDGADCLLTALDAERAKLVDVAPAMTAHLRNVATHYRQGPPVTGFVTTGDTLWVTVSRDVTTTDKQPTKVPGRFMTCTRIDDAWLARLRKFTRLAISFQRADQPPANDAEREARARLAANPQDVTTVCVSDEQTSSFCWMEDIYGQRCVLVRVDRDRPLLAQGQSIIRSSMLVIAGAGCLLLGLTLFGVSRMLRRLGNLMRGVEALRTGSVVQVPVIGNDEIATLTTGFNEMSAKIRDRERSLSAINDHMKLVLDSTGDGLVTCDLRGRIVGSVSKCAEEWFGAAAGDDVWDYLFRDDARRRDDFRLGWEQLLDDFLPFELLVDQMPRRLRRGERELSIDFRRVAKGERTEGFLLIVRDISADLERERAEQEARELQGIVQILLRDPTDFERFLDEMQKLVTRELLTEDERARLRSLHTVKGNAAVYGFLDFADHCHRVESAIAEGQAFDTVASKLTSNWDEAVRRVRQFLPERNETAIRVSPAELARFVVRLRNGGEPGALADVAESWRLPTVASAFARLGRQAQRVATALGKDVTVDAVDNGLRFDPVALAPFWEAVIHVVRNAIDHGLESPEQRLAGGKPAVGRLQLRAEHADDGLVVTIADDGKGIDWVAMRESAKKRGLPHATDEDLTAALFTDGVSTRETVTTTSGRGVGLAAVKAACEALGGRVELQSRAGLGTTFTFRLPSFVGATTNV